MSRIFEEERETIKDWSKCAQIKERKVQSKSRENNST